MEHTHHQENQMATYHLKNMMVITRPLSMMDINLLVDLHMVMAMAMVRAMVMAIDQVKPICHLENMALI